jgi:hypothetical protein
VSETRKKYVYPPKLVKKPCARCGETFEMPKTTKYCNPCFRTQAGERLTAARRAKPVNSNDTRLAHEVDRKLAITGSHVRTAFGTLLVCLCLASSVVAQTPILGTERLAWDQEAPDLATAQGYRYLPVVNGLAPSAEFQGVTCTGATSPFVCSVRLLALPTGINSIAVIARAVVPGEPGQPPLIADSAPSDTLNVLVVVVPIAPQHVRIQ